MPKLVLFDIDGTLLLSRGIGREAKRRAMLERFGSVGALDDIAFGGKTDWHILAELLAPLGYTPGDIGREMPAYEQIMARHMRQIQADFQAQPLPHALDVVTNFRDRADVTVGIVTGNTSLTAKIKLEMAGFQRNWFAIGAFGSEAMARADLTRLARKRGSDHADYAFADEDIFVIGDTPDDIAAARAINAKAIAVSTGYVPREQLVRCQPDALLNSLAGLPKFVLR